MEKKVPFLDLRIADYQQRQDLLKAIDNLFCHGRIVLGPEVEELEKLVADYCGKKYGVGVNSGTDALFLGLKGLGIGPGDEVITTALSWIATANAIALAGASPVFADIKDNLNIDPESVKKLVTKNTKAIMPVHYTGKMCNMDELLKICADSGLFLIEDASQAFGAGYQGRKAGSLGIISCFSMNPMKIYAACGEAGMILTDRRDIYERLVALRYNGTINREECIEPSLNGRMDTLQAAILLQRFHEVEDIIKKRRQIAAWYGELLAPWVEIPKEENGEYDVYYTYTIRAQKRDELKYFLETKGVETKIQHPILMPQQLPYRNNRGEYSNALRLTKEILCLPANEKLSKEDVIYVAGCIKEFYQEAD